MWQFSNNAKFIAVNVNATRRCLFCDTSQHICIGMKVTWRAFFEMTHWIEGRGDERINDLTLFCHWPPAICLLWSAPRPSHFYSFSLFFWNINKNKRNFHSKKKRERGNKNPCCCCRSVFGNSLRVLDSNFCSHQKKQNENKDLIDESRCRWDVADPTIRESFIINNCFAYDALIVFKRLLTFDFNFKRFFSSYIQTVNF